ncbi:DUF2514 family protein [Yokenella regensburgei]|uniref:DUF2514 family protein n=1 Tax=Yokenella regensburgei TaxID=158877 RepID=UPI003ED899BA
MMTMLKLLWKPLTAGGLLLLALWGFSHMRYEAGYQAADSAWSLKDEERKKNDALALASRESEARKEEARRQSEANKAAKMADAEADKLRADADDAVRARDELRGALSTIKRQLADSETGRLSAIAEASAARANTAILLANMLESADQRAGELAEYADRARVAGQTCERVYNQIARKNGESE